MQEIYINPFEKEYHIPELTEYQMVMPDANYGVILLDYIPHPNTVSDMTISIGGKKLKLIIYGMQASDYPNEDEAAYFTNDRTWGVLYVHLKHVNAKALITYKYITKNLIRDNESFLELFEVGEPFPLLHKIENNPAYMLCNGAKFNKEIYKKLYAKLGSEYVPDYCSGFIASETDNSKIQKVQKYEYPRIGYMGESSHANTYNVRSNGGCGGTWGGCGMTGFKENVLKDLSPVIYNAYVNTSFKINFDTNLGTENIDFIFSNELAPKFCGLYWYIKTI